MMEFINAGGSGPKYSTMTVQEAPVAKESSFHPSGVMFEIAAEKKKLDIILDREQATALRDALTAYLKKGATKMSNFTGTTID